MAQAERRRRFALVAVAGASVVALVVLVFVLSRSGDDTVATGVTTPTTASTSTETTEPAESATGKPCVPFDDELPPGAPEVPVPVGEPPTELVSEDLASGSGAAASLGDSITVNYIGVSCSTGKIFDDSWSRGQPASFPLVEGGLIEGWTQAIPGMQPGGRRLLVIPPGLGYGSQGRPGIAPDETLVFVVELVSAESAPPTTTGTAPAPVDNGGQDGSNGPPTTIPTGSSSAP